MSKDIIIQEGGKGYPFGPVKCLMVEGDDGEFYPWYPEADRALDSLSVTQNGIYRASDRGVYGWSRVSVNVAQSDRVTGKDPDTGEEKTVTVDPDTGELVETVVPVEIRVTTLPTKTEYTEGETIDYSGIVVHAYSSTGQDMGAVPFGELVFPVTTADAGGEEWSDGSGITAKRITTLTYYDAYDPDEGYIRSTEIIGKTNYSSEPYDNVYIGTDMPAQLLVTMYNGDIYAASVAGVVRCKNVYQIPYEDSFYYYGNYNYGEFTPARFGWMDNSYANKAIYLPSSTVNPTTVDPANLHATQSLPVQWQRPGDGAILETSFNITITGGE